MLSTLPVNVVNVVWLDIYYSGFDAGSKSLKIIFTLVTRSSNSQGFFHFAVCLLRVEDLLMPLISCSSVLLSISLFALL